MLTLPITSCPAVLVRRKREQGMESLVEEAGTAKGRKKRAEEESTGRREVRNKGATSTGCGNKCLVPTSQRAPSAQETAECLPSQQSLLPPDTEGLLRE